LFSLPYSSFASSFCLSVCVCIILNIVGSLSVHVVSFCLCSMFTLPFFSFVAFFLSHSSVPYYPHISLTYVSFSLYAHLFRSSIRLSRADSRQDVKMSEGFRD
jgi:hypothetical protein